MREKKRHTDPPYLIEVFALACSNLPNSLSISSFVIPIPVSVTANVKYNC
jgi:hypothetical protein